jgi:hypothetical protein
MPSLGVKAIGVGYIGGLPDLGHLPRHALHALNVFREPVYRYQIDDLATTPALALRNAGRLAKRIANVHDSGVVLD